MTKDRTLDRDALVALIAEQLRGTYYCNRVWEAWHVGTMSAGDFSPIDESDIPDEIADAILAKLNADRAQSAQAVAEPDEREAFEAWIKKDAGDLSTFGQGRNMHYSNSAVNNSWTGWKARASLATLALPTPKAETVMEPVFEGGRESVDDAIAVVESFGLGISGLNDTFARQILLADEVKRLRKLYESAVAGRADMRGALREARRSQAAGKATKLDFTKPLETHDGMPVKWVAHDVVEYQCARVCVDAETGVVYSSPYVGLKIRNVAEPGDGRDQARPPMDELANHLRDAHTFIENTEAFGHTAGYGILECGGCTWNIDESKAALAKHEAQPAVEPVDGDLLPPIGSRVYIRHGRDDDAHACIVTGYYVWGDLKGDKSLHRVFVRLLYEGTATPQARMLCDCYPTAEATLAKEQAKVDSSWWRKRADEIELQVAQTGSPEAMRCFTDMRTLLQSAALAQPAVEPVADWIPFSKRQSLAERHGHKVTAEFNALVRDVIRSYLETHPAPAPNALDAETAFLQETDQNLLHRFIETSEDDESYDISKDDVKRLANLGVLESCGFGRYGVTMFGYWAHERFWHQNPSLPLKTNADRDREKRAAIAAQSAQGG